MLQAEQATWVKVGCKKRNVDINTKKRLQTAGDRPAAQARSLLHTSLLEPLRTPFGCKQDLFYLNSFHTMFSSYYFSSLNSSQISPPPVTQLDILSSLSPSSLKTKKAYTKQTNKKKRENKTQSSLCIGPLLLGMKHALESGFSIK